MFLKTFLGGTGHYNYQIKITIYLTSQTSEIAINSPWTPQSCHLILVHLMLKPRFWPKMTNCPSWSISFECYRFKFEDLNHFLAEWFKTLNVLGNLYVRKFLIKFLIFLDRIAVCMVILSDHKFFENFLSRIFLFQSSSLLLFPVRCSLDISKCSLLNWEKIAGKHRYCSFIFKCLAFPNSWQVHQQWTTVTVRVVWKM